MTYANGIVFLNFLVLNFLSLYLVASKNKTVKRLASPGFLFGDFFLIPLYFVLCFVFLADSLTVIVRLPIFTHAALILTSILVVLAFGQKFHLLLPIWLPHGLVFLSIVYLLGLSITVLALVGVGYLQIATLIAILSAHQLLGTVFPKKL